MYKKFLSVSECKTIIKSSINKNEWDSWGVRDIAPLSDEFGGWIFNKDILTLYYSGSSTKSKGTIQNSGIAFYDTAKNKVIKYNKNPFLKSDYKITTTPWVMKTSDGYFQLLYRTSDIVGINEFVSHNYSLDSMKFPINTSKKILSVSDFKGLYPKSIMGVLNCCKLSDSNFLILFEGHNKKDTLQIYGATTFNWKDFKPYNNGYPVFCSKTVKSWPIKEVANPRLILLDNGWYMLCFNGSYAGEYAIGIAYTKDFITWIEHLNNPILVPRGWPPQDPFSGRLEGANFNRKEIIKGEKKISCLFMAIPYGARNHENSVNAEVIFKVKDPVDQKFNIFGFPVKPENIKTIHNSIYLKALNEPSFFLHAHHILATNMISAKFNLTIKTISKDSSSYIVFSNTLNSLPRDIGTILKITNDNVFIRQNLQKKPEMSFFPRFLRFIKKVRKNLELIFNLKIDKPHAPQDGWIKVFQIINRNPVKIEYSKDENDTVLKPKLKINDNLVKLPEVLEWQNVRIISMACYKTNVVFKDIKFINC